MILIENLSGHKTKAIPFWFMRQAGRYLPEYKKVRTHFPHFLKFCYTPEAACEVTLQPITRFGMSAAIIFSDILVIPDALGVDVQFQENIGPVLTPVYNTKNLSIKNLPEKLAPVYEALRLTRAALPTHTALIGFCGSPWTLACYMIQGKSSRDFSDARSFAFKEPVNFLHMMELITESVIQHALAQIEAGANAIQLFDSWSGVLSENEFEQYVITPTQKIVATIKEKFPSVPLIGFPRLCGEKIGNYIQKTKVDGVSFDGSISLGFAKNITCTAQGNLDSILLAEDKKEALKQTKKILDYFNDKPFVFNLAHGVLPHTPIEHVQAVTDLIKNNP